MKFFGVLLLFVCQKERVKGGRERGEREEGRKKIDGKQKDVHILIPGTCDMLPYLAKGESRRQRELRLEIS